MKHLGHFFQLIALTGIVTVTAGCQTTAYTYGNSQYASKESFVSAYKADIEKWIDKVSPQTQTITETVTVHVPSLRSREIYGVSGSNVSDEARQALSKFGYDIDAYVVDHIKKRNIFSSVKVKEFDNATISPTPDSDGSVLYTNVSGTNQLWSLIDKSGVVYRVPMRADIAYGYYRTAAFVDSIECVLSKDQKSSCNVEIIKSGNNVDKKPVKKVLSRPQPTPTPPITVKPPAKAPEQFRSFYKEYKAVDGIINCLRPKLTPAQYGLGALYGCVEGSGQTVKVFVNENGDSPGTVSNIKFLWNDWFKDTGYGLHADKTKAQSVLKSILGHYAPSSKGKITQAFFGKDNQTFSEGGMSLRVKYHRGPAIDERVLIITSKQ